MEGEINNFMKVWFSVFISLCYCYAVSKKVSKGPPRLLCLLPIVCLFFFLPLNLHSLHLGGTTAFFIAWLANFKLLLFAFGKGPLSSDPSISLGRFVAIACLPIKIQQNQSHRNDQNKENPPPKTSHKSKYTQNETIPSPPISHPNGQNKENPPPKTLHKPKFTQNETNPSPPISHLNGQAKENPTSKKPKKSHFAIKSMLVAILIRVYDYNDHIHPKLVLLLYCFHIYFLLEIILAIMAALARTLFGMELEPQFNEPYLSTSLQDFWGKRWNLMVPSILRPTVYEPTLKAATRVVGRKWAPLPAINATFLVSALMHELVFYYLGRTRPTWEVTWFFLLHGLCLTVEIVLKKAFSTSTRRLPRLVSGGLTIGFVLVTSFWLFFPQFLRCKADVRAFEEYAALGAFFNNVTRVFV